MLACWRRLSWRRISFCSATAWSVAELMPPQLPDLFERKFQQRLEPLLERYRLLAHAQELLEPAREPLQRPALRWNWPLMRRLGTQDDHDASNKAA